MCHKGSECHLALPGVLLKLVPCLYDQTPPRGPWLYHILPLRARAALDSSVSAIQSGAWICLTSTALCAPVCLSYESSCFCSPTASLLGTCCQEVRLPATDLLLPLVFEVSDAALPADACHLPLLPCGISTWLLIKASSWQRACRSLFTLSLLKLPMLFLHLGQQFCLHKALSVCCWWWLLGPLKPLGLLSSQCPLGPGYSFLCPRFSSYLGEKLFLP